jgi:7-cyano-7-deazaguanine reductase
MCGRDVRAPTIYSNAFSPITTKGSLAIAVAATPQLTFHSLKLRIIMAANTPSPINQQGLVIESTPRAEMNLFPLDTFAYEFPGKEIKINFEIPEFTAICPFSDFPDFALIRIEYVPNARCIELKSLKLYINSFRNVKIFHEHVINIILEDFVAACDPLSVEIEGDFHVRGNIKTVVRASYQKP